MPANPGTALPSHEPRRAGRWKHALPPLAAAASVIFLVVVALAVRSGSPGPQPAGARGGSPTAPSFPAYRLVSSVNLMTKDLDCVTESVCYAWFTGSGDAARSERTSDGGATWHQLARLPYGQAFDDSVEPSCPTASTCVAATDGQLTLAVTSDGGTSWRLVRLPALRGYSGSQLDQVSCATAQECVVHISSGTFLSTTNGGRNWIAATHVPGNAPGTLQLLRCNPSGRCIGAVSAGLGTAYSPGDGPGLEIMRSADHRLSWTFSSTGNVPSESVSDSGLSFLMSCGDGLHCLYAAGSSVAITSDGGVTWQQLATPAAWQGWTITSVSCPEGLDCSVALAPALASQVPVIQTTSDGMTWTAQPLPSTGNDPLQYVTYLSCARPGGCLGLGSTLSEDEAAFLDSGGFDHGIIETSPQLEVSSLGG